MPYLDPEKYRERERHWRSEASLKPEGAERDACVALADGYAHLVAILERLDQGPRPAGGEDGQ
jgi:hypothetical protein